MIDNSSSAGENTLDSLLRLAATDPARRPEFYRALLDGEVFVLGEAGTAKENAGRTMLRAGEKVAIQNWATPDGSPVIPFFSSLEALRKAISQDAPFLSLPVRGLFELTRGATLVLNPRTDYSKEFTPSEVEALLAEGVTQRAVPRIVEQETQVLLGQPAERPEAMLRALSDLLARHSTVKAAYLALMHEPSKDEKPHFLLGIDAEGDAEQAMREIGTVAGEISPNGTPVDLVRVTSRDDSLSRYFLDQSQPFYRRNRWADLKAKLSLR